MTTNTTNLFNILKSLQDLELGWIYNLREQVHLLNKNTGVATPALEPNSRGIKNSNTLSVLTNNLLILFAIAWSRSAAYEDWLHG
jgi:hypothetical protein